MLRLSIQATYTSNLVFQPFPSSSRPPCGTHTFITRILRRETRTRGGCPPTRRPKDGREGPTTIGCGLPRRSQWALRTPGGASDSGGCRRRQSNRRERAPHAPRGAREIWEEQTQEKGTSRRASEKPSSTLHCHRSPGGVMDPASGLAGRVVCRLRHSDGMLQPEFFGSPWAGAYRIFFILVFLLFLLVPDACDLSVHVLRPLLRCRVPTDVAFRRGRGLELRLDLLQGRCALVSRWAGAVTGPAMTSGESFRSAPAAARATWPPVSEREAVRLQTDVAGHDVEGREGISAANTRLRFSPRGT